MKNMMNFLLFSFTLFFFSCSQKSQYLVQPGLCNYCDQVFHGDTLVFQGYAWREEGYHYDNPPTQLVVLVQDSLDNVFIAAKDGSWKRSFPNAHCDFVVRGCGWEFLPVVEITFNDSLMTTLLISAHTGENILYGYEGFFPSDCQFLGTWMYHYEDTNRVKEWCLFDMETYQTVVVSEEEVLWQGFAGSDSLLVFYGHYIVVDFFGKIIADQDDFTSPLIKSCIVINEDGQVWNFLENRPTVDSFRIDLQNFELNWWIESVDGKWLMIDLDEYGWSMRSQRWLINLQQREARLLQDWSYPDEAEWGPNESYEFDSLVRHEQDTLSINKVWCLIK